MTLHVGICGVGDLHLRLCNRKHPGACIMQYMLILCGYCTLYLQALGLCAVSLAHRSYNNERRRVTSHVCARQHCQAVLDFLTTF